MIAFSVGVSAIFAVLMGLSLWLQPYLDWYPRDDVAMLIARSIIAPGLSAWAAAELVNAIRHLRLFDRRIQKRSRAFLAGIATGILGAAGASIALALGDERVHELVILSGCSAAATVIVLLPFRRVIPGQCIHCGYDLRAQPGPGTPGSGICPECGSTTWRGLQSAA